MFSGSRRRSIHERLTSPFGCAAIHGKAWSVAFASSETWIGADQVAPRSRDTDIRTSELAQGGIGPVLGDFLHEPFGKSVQATRIVPSVATAAVGKLLAMRPRSATKPKSGSAFFR